MSLIKKITTKTSPGQEAQYDKMISDAIKKAITPLNKQMQDQNEEIKAQKKRSDDQKIEIDKLKDQLSNNTQNYLNSPTDLEANFWKDYLMMLS